MSFGKDELMQQLNVKNLEISEKEESQSIGLYIGNCNIKPRNYWKWLLISIITLGIGFVVYNYLVFTDMKKHFENHHLPVGEVSAPIDDEPWIPLILLVAAPFTAGISLAAFAFYKYEKMHKHLANEHTAYEPQCMSGIQVIVWSICTFFVGFFFAEAQFQRAWNYHIFKTHKTAIY